MHRHLICTSTQGRYLASLASYHLPSTAHSFFHVYTYQLVPYVRSRLVYQLGVINLISTYPGTYVVCFYFNPRCSHHLLSSQSELMIIDYRELLDRPGKSRDRIESFCNDVIDSMR